MDHSSLFNNTTAVDNSSHLCMPVYDYIAGAPLSRKTLMCIIFIMLSIVSAFVNSVVVYAIIKTKQYQNQSLFLILCASITDIGCALITNFWYLVYIVMGDRIRCQTKYLMFAISVLPVYGSAYMFSVISLDRYLRVHFLHKYHEVLSNVRYNFVLAAYMSFVILQSALSGIGASLFGHFQGAKLTFPINTIVISLTVIWYLMSIFKLRQHQRKQKFQSVDSKRLTNMASLYLIIYFACYAPVVINQILLRILLKLLHPIDISYLSYSAFYFQSVSGIANAVAFLKKNRPAKDLLRIIRQVQPHDETTRQTRPTTALSIR